MDYFEQSALDRLRLLHELDQMSQNGTADLSIRIYDMCKARGLNDTEKDTLSHFTLKLAFCQNEEWRRWFTKMETKLFRCRFEQAVKKDKKRFLETQKIPVALCDNVDQYSSSKFSDSKEFYKVPFTMALDLLSHRRVSCLNGYAIVPFKEVITIVTSLFRSHLSKTLTSTYRASHRFGFRLEKIAPLLSVLRSSEVMDRSYCSKVKTGQVQLDQLPRLVKESFPPCMRNLNDNLQAEHHLKYDGRNQLGLFLKGIGLTVEDSLQFWSSSFQPKIPRDVFEKKYAYNVRYIYGKEGRRADWKPFGCGKIISGSAPGNGQHHGCPFKHFDSRNLRLLLNKIAKDRGVSVDEIVNKASEGHYQVACQLHFMLMHPGATPVNVGNHPNAYFDESRAFLEKQ